MPRCPRDAEGCQCDCRKQKRDAYDLAVLGISVGTLVAVVVYACFARQQVMAIKDSMEAENRAWVVPKVFIPAVTPEGWKLGQPMDLKVSFQNFGGRPAAHTNINVATWIADAALRDVPDVPASVTPAAASTNGAFVVHRLNGVIGPGDQETVDMPTPPMDAGLIGKISYSNRFFYIFGTVAYEDGFAARAGHFCFIWVMEDRRLRVPARFVWCPIPGSNEADWKE